MTAEELAQIIAKYKVLSNRYESRDEEKSIAYDRSAEFLKDYPRHSGLSESDDEEGLWHHFLEVEDESNNWYIMFPGRGDEYTINIKLLI